MKLCAPGRAGFQEVFRRKSGRNPFRFLAYFSNKNGAFLIVDE
jgi:hypothetical protein